MLEPSKTQFDPRIWTPKHDPHPTWSKLDKCSGGHARTRVVRSAAPRVDLKLNPKETQLVKDTPKTLTELEIRRFKPNANQPGPKFKIAQTKGGEPEST